MNPQLLNIDGYDGSDDPDRRDIDQVHARAHQDMDRRFPLGWREQWDAGDETVRAAARDLFDYHLLAPTVIRFHNLAVPAAQMYVTAARLAPLAAAEAGHLYEALGKSTTVNWLAAHHAFVSAAVRARDLLTEVVNAAVALRGSDFGRSVKDLALVMYERAVPAGQRLTVPDVDEAQLALTGFVETTRARLDILRATVSGGYPEGFTPAPEHPGPALSGPVEDDWLSDRQAGTAVVAAERAW